MRLSYLELENWSCHQSLSVDLSEGLQIEGRNGTGKSSILSAIRFIFKETARGYNSRIRNGQRSASVRLKFTCDGQEYLVEKKLYVDKASTALMLQGETLIADNPSSVHSRLQSILSEDVLDKLLYIPQGGITGILDRLSGKDGKVEMDRLFSLDRLEHVWEKTGVQIQESEAALRFLSDQLTRYPDDALDGMHRKECGFKDRISSLSLGMKSSSLELERIKMNLAETEGRLKKIQETKLAVDSLKDEGNMLKVEEAGTIKEAESLRERLAQIGNKVEELESILKTKASLEKYTTLRDIMRQLHSVDDRLKALEDLKSKRERLIELDSILNGKEETVRSYNELKAGLKSLEDERATLMANLKREAEYYSQLGGLDGHAKCPRCGQKVNAFIVEGERTETAYKIKSIEEARRAVEGKISGHRQALKSAEERLNSIKNAEAEHRHLRSDVDEKGRQSADLLAARGALEKSLMAAGYRGESQGEVDSRCTEYNMLDGRVQSLRKEVKDVDSLSTKATALEGRLRLLRETSSKIDTKLSSMAYSEDERRTLSAGRDALAEGKYKMGSELRTMESEIKRAQEELTRTEEDIKVYSELTGKHVETRRQAELLKAARDVFHRDKGLVRYLREGFIHKLNVLLTSHFKRFNQNPRYVDVNFDRDYNIILRTTSGDIGLEQISGGERVQLALALRIALIDMISPIPLLILDEPFGSLDEAHRELLGESLNKTAQQGQLILVTHVHVDSLQLPNRLELGGY
ncbi:MAG: SMC family ATPase [Candidatus Altiarchaeota archaeon]